jgi:magnesium-transporting ATPase (P-type)
MSKRSRTTIIIGLLVFAVILSAALTVYVISATSGPENMDSPQRQVDRLQSAQTTLTLFLYTAVLDLAITGMLAYQWRKAGIPQQSSSYDQEELQKGNRNDWVQCSLFAGTIAFVVDYVGSLLDVFVLDIYGGFNPVMLICTGTPALLFGALGGFVWSTIKRRSKFTPLDRVVLILIGILAGVLPGVCVKSIPQ